MTSLVLCILGFIASFGAGARSLVSGLVTVIAIGYFYGITRANVPETYSHFIFDAAVMGLYCSLLIRRPILESWLALRQLRDWVTLLAVWAIILFFIPIQDTWIQLVGLRGNIFLLPFLLLGAQLDNKQKYSLALWLGVLNLAAFAFAGAEFVLGVEPFFPKGGLTQMIYMSHDVAGYSAFRIPATFSSAHVYAGTMVTTLPWLAGAAMQKHRRQWHFYLLIISLSTALVGVFMAATRVNIVIAFVLLLVGTFSIRSKAAYAMGWLLILLCIGWLVLSDVRLQRFTTLQDTGFISERITYSVNMNFFEMAAKYPFGNGLGGGGTSIPYFLQDRISDPVLMENEYARIMLELGIPGLCMWLAFIIWALTRSKGPLHDSWRFGQRLAWMTCALYFASGLIGTGLLASVPHTCLLLLGTGWVAAGRPDELSMESLAQNHKSKTKLIVQQYS